MYIYFGVLIVYILLQYILKKKKMPYERELTIGIMLVFGLLTAFRGSSVGNDTESYLRIFRMNIEGTYLDAWNDRFEMGYMFLNKILSVFGFEQLILIVTSIITYGCFTYFILEWSDDFELSIYMFFLLRYFAETMNTIRLCMACAVLLVAYDRYLKKHMGQFLLCVILAMSFHRTALVYLIVLLFKYIKFDDKLLKIWVCVTSIGFLCLPLGIRIMIWIFPNFSYYLGSSYEEKGVSMAGVLYTIVWLMIFVICYMIQRVYCHKKIELKSMNLMMMVAISIFVLTMRFNLFDRIAQYFAIMAIVYLPNCINMINNTKVKNIARIGVIVFGLCYFWTIQLLRPEWNVITPYVPFWKN